MIKSFQKNFVCDFMKKFLLILIPLILLAGLGVGAFRSYKQMQSTPTNSVKVIRDSLENHDAETFYKFFDADKILENAAQEILTAQINSEVNSTTYSTQDMENIYNSRKVDFISSAQSALNDYVSSGKIKFPENLSATQKWLKDSEVTRCSIKNISKFVVKDGKAHAKVEFYNSSLRFSFELEIFMEKFDKQNWRVVGVKGFENYLSGLNRALKKKLESLNAPIREKISDVFVVKGYDAKVVGGDEYGFSKTLRLTMKADVKTEKTLAKILGKIIIVGRSGSEGVTPFEIDMAYKPKGLQNFTVDKVLNPFVREDADAMKHGLRRSDLHVEITEIIYMDGTSLKQLDELPQ